MIVCKKCGDVLYTNTMPEGVDEVVEVMCLMCASRYTMSVTIEERIILI